MTTALLPVLLLASAIAGPGNPISVVTSLTTYAAIAREITGDFATVTAIAQGDEDPHFVQPRPSFLPLLRDADLFVTTGMDLELWVPTLLDRAGNANVREGGRGYVAAYRGIRLLEVPATVSRSEGDIHVAGNPHIHTDPVNAIVIARNILAGLQRVDAANAAEYERREQEFEARVLRATVGDELVRILTATTVFDLLRGERFFDFIQRTPYQGRPLATRLGGWMQQAAPLRGRQMVCYHKEWAYFTARYGVACVDFIESKPGIPPTPGHVRDIIALMRERRIPVLFASNYFSRRQIREVSERTGATPVVVAENVGGAPGTATYFELVDTWIAGLVQGFATAAEGR